MDNDDTTRTPPPAALRRFRTPLRGHAFATPPPGAGGVDDGTPAVLVREPTNPADPLAVAVWVTLEAWGPWRLGYLDRGVAARIAPRLDAGLDLHAELEGWTSEPGGRWQRPLIALWPAGEDDALLCSPAPLAPGGGRAVGSAARDARVERRLPGVRRRRLT